MTKFFKSALLMLALIGMQPSQLFSVDWEKIDDAITCVAGLGMMSGCGIFFAHSQINGYKLSTANKARISGGALMTASLILSCLLKSRDNELVEVKPRVGVMTLLAAPYLIGATVATGRALASVNNTPGIQPYWDWPTFLGRKTFAQRHGELFGDQLQSRRTILDNPHANQIDRINAIHDQEIADHSYRVHKESFGKERKVVLASLALVGTGAAVVGLYAKCRPISS